MDLTIFIALTAVAILIQAGVLLAMYITVRRSSSKMEALANEVRTKVLPVLETTNSLIVELRPKVETAIANVSDSTTVIRNQIQRLDATLSDVIDRTHLQVIRADDLIGHSMDKLEETTEMLRNAVVSPVRHVSGLVHGISAAVEHLARSRRHRDSVPQDEMFI
jgi:hypothetical protein